MDLEEDIRSLQLESAEDYNGAISPEDAKPEELEKMDETDEGWKEEIATNSHPVHVEPKGKEIAVPEEVDIMDEMEEYSRNDI
ncbi:hypothetical protein NL676_029381 [Syzygium grande]|nr:hypothetical protein NL676_029381 [Syzygium grande]